MIPRNDFFREVVDWLAWLWALHFAKCYDISLVSVRRLTGPTQSFFLTLNLTVWNIDTRLNTDYLFFFWDIILIDLKPHDDIYAVVHRRLIFWLVIHPSICSQPIVMGKELLRLPPFYAKCLLIYAYSLWTSLPYAVIDVGLPSSYPKC